MAGSSWRIQLSITVSLKTQSLGQFSLRPKTSYSRRFSAHGNYEKQLPAECYGLLTIPITITTIIVIIIIPTLPSRYPKLREAQWLIQDFIAGKERKWVWTQIFKPRLWSMWSEWLVFCDCGFQSVCPLMEKDKRFMEASWWERLTEGETESCSDGWGHAQQIFNPIFCWRAGLCSLPMVWSEAKLWWR